MRAARQEAGRQLWLDVYTNKRILFDGAQRNSTIRWSGVIAFQPYRDGLVIEKATGRSPHLILEGDAELAAVICGAILAGSAGEP